MAKTATKNEQATLDDIHWVATLLFNGQALLNKMGYLYERWQDEKEFEDWKDYSDEMEKLIEPFVSANKRGVVVAFERAYKRPFGFTITMSRDGIRTQYRVSVNSHGEVSLVRDSARRVTT
jgi:hypothetical protein